MENEKVRKPVSLKQVIIFGTIGIVVAIALIIGTAFALKYENLLTVFFSSSDYEATDAEKELCEEIEAEGIVLLKNEDGALPLSSDEKKLAVLGPGRIRSRACSCPRR